MAEKTTLEDLSAATARIDDVTTAEAIMKNDDVTTTEAAQPANFWRRLRGTTMRNYNVMTTKTTANLLLPEELRIT